MTTKATAAAKTTAAPEAAVQRKKSGGTALHGGPDGPSKTLSPLIGQTLSPLITRTLQSTGEPLDPSTRAFFEPRFGHNFGDVRVHTDTKAAESARHINAQAYSIGKHIVFGAGRYAPKSAAGDRLLAHELTHVVQQRHTAAIPQHPRLKEDPYSEREADHIAEHITAGKHPIAALPVVQRFADPAIARQQAPAQEFPGFSQSDYKTCGAAALVSALLIWDKERKDPNAPNSVLVNACNLVLLSLDKNKAGLIQRWDTLVPNVTGQAQFDNNVNIITWLRDAAKLPGAKITENQYQQLGNTIYLMYAQKGQAGLSIDQINSIQTMLGIGGTTEQGDNFDALLDKLTGLKEGQTAQLDWYSRGNLKKDGTWDPTRHAFLIGRFKRGAWYLSDQGSKPPTELEAGSLDLLRVTIKANTAAKDSGIHTGGQPIVDLGGGRMGPIAGGRGNVTILGDAKGVEKQARDVVMKPGEFIAEVDASVWHDGDRLIAWDLVDHTTSLADAQTALAGAGTGSGGVILEKPLGLFHVYKTNLVSDINVNEKSIDDSDSSDGAVFPGNHRFTHAWIQLRSSTQLGSFFKVY